ncbi:MAG TPA: TIGR04290 family methyltransferase [Thermoanaerobaculia bacterium]|nr:TIGR04290 family methyltransferase [Thermoanaerobaculia bacterium]
MELTTSEIEQRVRSLGRWFHNIDLHGVKTAPDHFLGDYPNIKWQRFAHAVPEDLSGKTVLDIGCNAGFYSIEMKKRGAARVVAVDSDEMYLNQGRFAAEVSGFPDIEFRNLSVYDVGKLGEKFDLVIFMGVLYHLRHPLLALDMLYGVVDELMIFQSMQRGSTAIPPLETDYPFTETSVFARDGYPLMYFVENRYAGDPTNWWIPNRACVEAMLRSAGFAIEEHPEDEVYICRKGERPAFGDA